MIEFGTNGDDDDFEYTDNDDRLYGMGGNDTIDGGDGDDYIEGGDNDDSTEGAKGDLLSGDKVIAFRGTEPTKLDDFVVDKAMSDGAVTNQMIDAMINLNNKRKIA